MPLRSLKTLSWIVVIWFALLQAMSPLIHGHMDTDHPDLIPALHLHEGDYHHQADSQHGPFVVDASHVTHTISVAAGISNQRGMGLDLSTLLLLIVCLLSLPKTVLSRLFVVETPADYSTRHRHPVAHAPPAVLA